MDDSHLLAKIGQYALIKNDEGKLLVLERARSKTWCLPGGRLDKKEDWDNCLLRELKEELGAEYKDPKPFTVNIITDPYQVKYCVYFTVVSSNTDTLIISNEHSSFRWVGREEALKLNFEDEKVSEVVASFLA